MPCKGAGERAAPVPILAPMAEDPVPDQFNIVVKDMEAAVRFYRRLGLDIADTEPEFQDHHRNASGTGGIRIDSDSVDFARHWNKGWKGGMGVLEFRVESRRRVDEIFSDLVSGGYRAQQEPYDAFFGARFAVVEDPDGNAVGIMSPLDDGYKSDVKFP